MVQLKGDIRWQQVNSAGMLLVSTDGALTAIDTGAYPAIEVDPPGDPTHGDLAMNLYRKPGVRSREDAVEAATRMRELV